MPLLEKEGVSFGLMKTAVMFLFELLLLKMAAIEDSLSSYFWVQL